MGAPGAPPPRAWLAALCLASAVWRAGAQGCVDTYKAVLKKPGGGTILPAEVGPLYLKWCKKNMKVSSAKSMDELCAPLARKAEEKMKWVPPELAVTPELTCKSVDKLKEEFPEQVAAAEAQQRAADE